MLIRRLSFFEYFFSILFVMIFVLLLIMHSVRVGLPIRTRQHIYHCETQDYTSYILYEDEIKELTRWFYDDFRSLYYKDTTYLSDLYRIFIADKVHRSRSKFRNHVEEYYGEIWELARTLNRKKEIMGKENLEELIRQYKALEPVVGFTAPVDELDHFQLSVAVGGGSLLTAGFLWRPWKWIGLQMGIAGAHDFKDEWTFTIPLELDFFIISKPFLLYAGVTVDLIKYQSANNTRDWFQDWIFPEKEGISVVTGLSAIGANIGIGIPVGKITIYMDNYLYIKTENFPNDLAYSPSIGIRF